MFKLLVRVILSVFTALYRATGGVVGGKVQGLRVAILTTTGAKTGKRRVNPVGYFKVDGNYVVIASNAGFDRHPGWYHNLLKNPLITLELGRTRLSAVAEASDPEYRERLWERLLELAPGYGAYQKRTSRMIPMVLLNPQEEA
ncbi:MAG TPA: nitroreductase family deazaflavin-dependent oxidoreductase [Anaerolineales bacterium]|nr:nitroreductase family deazaflavin-dependent oxidoreductase [Anaerolineales bacterium]